jgi:protoporphyrinogen oxidase
MYYATQDGQQLDEKLVESIQKETEQMIDSFEDLIANNNYEEDKSLSLGSLLEENFSKIVNEHGSEADPAILRSIFDSAVNNERFESSCANLNELSVSAWYNYERKKGNQFVKLKYGYAKLTENLAAKIPTGSIHLNHTVEKIDWSNLKSEYDTVKILVHDTETGERKTYTCDYVLITIPIGCLKKQYDDLFVPKFSTRKIESLNRLGFGCLDKLFVVFDRQFDADFQGLQIMWRNDLAFELDYSKKKWNLQVKIYLIRLRKLKLRFFKRILNEIQ